MAGWDTAGDGRSLDRQTVWTRPEIVDGGTVYSGYLTVDRLRIRLADGAEVWREVERHGDAVAVLPYDAERRCVLVVRLFRAPVFATVSEDALEEACSGMVGDETAEAASRREAHEELGLALGRLEFVARIWSSPGVTTERQTLFLAPYGSADRVGEGGGLAEEHEGITVVERTLADMATDIDQGRVADGKLLTLGLALRLRRPELFT